MSWHMSSFSWFSQLYGTLREYITGRNALNIRDSSGSVRVVEDDGGPDEHRNCSRGNSSSSATNSESENFQTVSDGARPVFNIHLPSNSGTVVIGENNRFSAGESGAATSGEINNQQNQSKDEV